jgi:DNA-binding MarR family transcriptional regulator
MKKPSDTVVRAWARLTKVQHLALTAIEQALKQADLPPLPWYDALLELERVGEEGLRPFELEREMLLAQYNLSRLVDRIEKAGYVERRSCDDDGRGQVIVITSFGKDIRRRMWPVYARAIQSSIGMHVSETQAETLDATLGSLLANSAAATKS